MKRFIVLLFATAAFAQRPDGPPPNRGEQPSEPPSACSMGTLHGDYIFAQDGLDNGKPLAAAGRESYDGNGHVKGVSTVSANGTIARASYTATYTMKSDCSGSLTVTDSAKKVHHYDIFSVPSGDEVVWIQTDPGSVSAGWQRRRPNRPPMPPR